VVEKANHSAAQRWWRTLADDATLEQAQAGVDRLALKLDGRRRVRDGQASTVGALAADEALRPPPLLAFPAEFDVTRTVTAQALVSFVATTIPSHPASAERRSTSATGSAPTPCAS
jgi:hypothetical protein